MSPRAPLARIFARVFGALALLLMAFLGVGIALGGAWTASASLEIPAPPAAVFEPLQDLERWEAFTLWGDVPSTLGEVRRGPGATRSWDHPDFGAGTLTLVEVEPPRRLTYRVVVDEGALVVEGDIVLEAVEAGTRVTWTERGDFGRNPLMGYQARLMPEAQGAQLRESLERLAAHVRASGAAADSLAP
ncbi:MAG: hypothetical protein D6701_07270 [Gemmatimonadetes bacterium]|nr:MAG: hypothetical protein D6701_07270 [Gemmatimonadota bacterium]